MKAFHSLLLFGLYVLLAQYTRGQLTNSSIAHPTNFSQAPTSPSEGDGSALTLQIIILLCVVIFVVLFGLAVVLVVISLSARKKRTSRFSVKVAKMDLNNEEGEQTVIICYCWK